MFTPLKGWGKLLIQVALANTVLVAAILLVNPDLSDWLLFSGGQRMAWLLGLVASVIALYFVTLMVLGLNPKRLFKKA